MTQHNAEYVLDKIGRSEVITMVLDTPEYLSSWSANMSLLKKILAIRLAVFAFSDEEWARMHELLDHRDEDNTAIYLEIRKHIKKVLSGELRQKIRCLPEYNEFVFNNAALVTALKRNKDIGTCLNDREWEMLVAFKSESRRASMKSAIAPTLLRRNINPERSDHYEIGGVPRHRSEPNKRALALAQEMYEKEMIERRHSAMAYMYMGSSQSRPGVNIDEDLLNGISYEDTVDMRASRIPSLTRIQPIELNLRNRQESTLKLRPKSVRMQNPLQETQADATDDRSRRGSF